MAWLIAKVAAFTLIVPGTVMVLVPAMLVDDFSLAAVDVYGLSFLGIVPLVLGTALYLRCAYDFIVSGRGTPAPIDPPESLVVSGPYHVTRNPMYVAVLLVLAGEALLLRSPPLAAYLLVMGIAFHLVITAYEELVLGQKFGDAYDRYREQVPRWIPRWRDLVALYRKSFLPIGALVLVAGVIAHTLRLTVGLPVVETPASIHGLLVILPAYAAIGCIVFVRHIALPGAGHRVVLGLVVLLLSITAIMHLYSIVAGDSRWLGVFPQWYSVVAAVLYAGFALFLETRSMAPD